MKLSDYKGEDALDLIADLMEPIGGILNDTKFRDAVESVQNNSDLLKIAKQLLKCHKKECIEILARVEDTTVAEYKPTVFELTKSVIELLGDPQVQELFISQGQIKDATSSGSAMESTEDKEK